MDTDTVGMSEAEFMEELEVQRYSKRELYGIYFQPVERFVARHINDKFEGRLLFDILSGAQQKKQPTKRDIVKMCAGFYTNKVLLEAFYDDQSTGMQKIITEATWHNSVSYAYINDAFGRQMFSLRNKKELYFYEVPFEVDEELFDWEPLLSARRTWIQDTVEEYLEVSDMRFKLPALMRHVYAQILPKPKDYYLRALSSVEGGTTFTAEQLIFKEMPLILAHYHQGKLRYTQKGYPNRASGRKMNKTLGLMPFPGKGPKEIRALMIAGLFSDDYQSESLTEPAIDVLHKLFSTDFWSYPTTPYILPHLKKLNGFRYTDFSSAVTNQLIEMFKAFPLGYWLTFENIKGFTELHSFYLQPVASMYDLHRIDTADDIRKGSYDFGGEDARNFIEIPTLAGHIYLLAAFGLMEIMVDQDTKPEFSYYDGLKACRLTDLGAYILGAKRDYTPPSVDNDTRLNFDDKTLVIRVEGNAALGEAMLEKYAEKVSENRYQFSPGKFLKDCHSQKDLKEKIKLFKTTIDQELPAFWVDYLNTLLENSTVIGKHKSNLEVFQLPRKDKDLHRLVARDKTLQQLITKAENFYFLVDKKDKKKFVDRMKELGYLVG